MKYIIYDAHGKTDEGVHAIFYKEDEALNELNRQDEGADGFYMITEDEENKI